MPNDSSEEITKPFTPGTGPKINKARISKRVRNAYRRANSELSMKEWARNENSDETKKWFDGKKQAHPPLKARPKIAKPAAAPAAEGKKRKK